VKIAVYPGKVLFEDGQSVGGLAYSGDTSIFASSATTSNLERDRIKEKRCRLFSYFYQSPPLTPR
jgi:hypothetical protein